MALKDLLKFLKSDPFKDEYYTRSDEWMVELDKRVPDWREIVKDPKNWDEIEKIKGIKYFENACEALVRGGGVELAIHWFDSEYDGRRDAAREYVRDLDSLDSHHWKKFGDKIKEYITYWWFDQSPGEPFDSTRRSGLELRHYDMFALVFLPQIEYIPSIKVRKLRSIVKEAGDNKYLKLINELIEERKQATSAKNQNNLILYDPSRDERELIARAINKFIRSGYKLKSLPPIYLSFEAPPIFTVYPELEEEGKERRDVQEKRLVERRIPRDRERGRPEIISIEELLGCYIPANPRIILWIRGINWLAKRNNYDREFLQAIVLLHEIGHWITHQLPKDVSFGWETELYISTEEDVNEGWAQLITWWVVHELGGEIEDIFKNLTKSQPSPYKVYENFKTLSIKTMINSLEALRNLKQPASLSVWKRIVK